MYEKVKVGLNLAIHFGMGCIGGLAAGTCRYIMRGSKLRYITTPCVCIAAWAISDKAAVVASEHALEVVDSFHDAIVESKETEK